MKKYLALLVFLAIAGIIYLGRVHAAYLESDFEEINADIEAKGVEKADIDSIEKPVKDMLERGHSKDKLKTTISDLSANGVKGRQLRKTIEAMNDMEKAGIPVDESDDKVSQAIQDAKNEGLKDQALAESVAQKLIQEISTDKRMDMDKTIVPLRDIPERANPERPTQEKAL